MTKTWGRQTHVPYVNNIPRLDHQRKGWAWNPSRWSIIIIILIIILLLIIILIILILIIIIEAIGSIRDGLVTVSRCRCRLLLFVTLIFKCSRLDCAAFGVARLAQIPLAIEQHWLGGVARLGGKSGSKSGNTAVFPIQCL